MAWKKCESDSGLYYVWDLERPRPALPNSYFWTWDHSANWVLDDPGLQTEGCYNAYYKRPDTFLEDYRRLTDLAAGLGIRGITVAGFLRDSHGGEEYAARAARYAARNGIALMPCLGTNWYRGPYYEGNHRYSLDTFLRDYPEARILDEHGQPRTFNGEYGASPGHPAFRQWISEALAWLLETFEIGGLNLENGDMLVDYSPATQALRPDWPEDLPEPLFFQAACYQAALEGIRNRLADSLVTYATYTGFNTDSQEVMNIGAETVGVSTAQYGALTQRLPAQAVCQWTLSRMVHQKSLPLSAYLDDGVPAAALQSPHWPAGLTPPPGRAVGFLHQGSQWSHVGRYECTIGAIKEACLRAFRAGLEGVSIHGEVSNRHIPYALNYLAFSHFVHWPEDSLRAFGRKTLGPVVGGPDDGEAFVEVLAHAESGTLTDELRQRARPDRHGFTGGICTSHSKDADHYQRYRFWHWLNALVERSSKEDVPPGLDF